MCLCNGPLVVMVILGWLWGLVLKAALCISMTFFERREEKASLIFSMFLTFCFVAWANVLLFWMYFDLARVSALGLGEMGGGILETLL